MQRSTQFYLDALQRDSDDVPQHSAVLESMSANRKRTPRMRRSKSRRDWQQRRDARVRVVRDEGVIS